MTAEAIVIERPDTAEGSATASRGLVAVFSVTVFFNAALLFSVEPMFAKIVLPFLGGTPSVWNTCLVFFQFALLVGYLYAHFSTRILVTRRHALAHGLLLVLSCLLLPLQLRMQADPPAGASGILWLLALLTTSLGIPFVMLASGALVAQRWFAQSSHPRATNPYFLYAASNLGSLVALISYPLLIEPWLSLREQRMAWSAGYLVLVGLTGLCAWMVSRRGSAARALPEIPAAAAPRVAWRDRGKWVLYSAVPAGLLLSVTTYLSTDVAAAPLLWILPLAVYLLTFVLVFDARARLPHSWMVAAEGYLLVIVCVPIFLGTRIPGFPGIVLHLVVLFVVAMVCHGDLARWRPPAERLTEFFVWISVGGLLGGIFSALIAPIAFDSIAEYPLLLAMAAALRPGIRPIGRRRVMDFLLAGTLVLVLVLVRTRLGEARLPVIVPVSVILGGIIFSFKDRPVRFGLAIGAVFLAANVAVPSGGISTLLTERSYFGVYRVEQDSGGRIRVLEHGTTIHGAQFFVPGRELEPLTYYHGDGPAGDIFSSTLVGRKPVRRVGVVGLGAGALACYGRTGESWTFYEIDPVVTSIARSPALFTYLRDCKPTVRVVHGDARLELVSARDSEYDILVLDAFSSDAIPVHLLTREAITRYLRVVAPGGLLAFHVSNRQLDLEPVLAAAARAEGLVARIRKDPSNAAGNSSKIRLPSDWAVLARSTAELGGLGSDVRWLPLRGRVGIRSWTDDFSNILEVVRW